MLRDNSLSKKFIQKWATPDQQKEFQRLLTQKQYHPFLRDTGQGGLHILHIESQLRGLRTAVRAQHHDSFESGVFKVNRITEYSIAVGMYGITWAGRLLPPRVLFYIELDAMGRHWFLTDDNQVINICGSSLDGIERIEDHEG